MIRMKDALKLPTGRDLLAWQNGASPMPGWVLPHVVGDVEANGSFLIAAPQGNLRVHRGHAVIEHAGECHGCPAEEVSDLVDQLRARARAAAEITAVGPGKRFQAGAKRGNKRSIVYAAPAGSYPSIEWVHVGALSIDPAYQRSTDNEASRRLIASIAAKFDWRLCPPLVVSRREDGTMAIIDGQHRWSAVGRRGDIPQLPCCIFKYANREEEAKMFIAANRARKPMNRLDDFYAALAAADEDALQIQQLVTDAGLSIARNTAAGAWRPGEVAFTASIASMIRRHGEAIVSAALTDMAEAFPGERLGHGGSIFLGLVKIFAHPPEGLDADRLIAALRTRTAAEWGQIVTKLKGGDTRATAMRGAILARYDELGAAQGEERIAA